MPFFESKPDYKPDIDYSRCTPIQVIATFNPEGKIMPVYVCIEDIYGNYIKAAITSIKYRKDGAGCETFCCLVQCGRRQQEINITYYFQDHKWVMDNLV
jgi:hypothetical protein